MVSEDDLLYVLTIFRDITGHFQSEHTYNIHEIRSEDFQYRIKKNFIIDLISFGPQTET